MQTFIVLLCLVASNSTAMAAPYINMRDGSLRYSETDLGQIERAYNSRSLFSGIFGLGWCSPLETSLQVKGARLTLLHCGQKSFFSGSLQKKGKWVQRRSLWHYTDDEGSRWVFSQKGKLLLLQSHTWGNIAITYDRFGLIEKTVHNHSLSLFWKWNRQQETVQSISDSEANQVHFLYQEGLLRQARAIHSILRYQYDKLDNLIRIENGTAQPIQIDYLEKEDIVRRLSTTKNCQDIFSLKLTNEKPLRALGTLDHTCASGERKKILLESTYALTNTHQFFLQKIRRIRPDTRVGDL